MKFIRKILAFAILMTIGVGVVNAEQVNGTVTITGTNTASKTLTLTTNSTTPGAYLKDIRWFYSSVLGDPESATSIPVTTNSLYLSQAYAGYYIYATAVITTSEDGYTDKSVSDVTDDATNGTAKVSAGTLVAGSVYISGTNTANETLTVNLSSTSMSGAYIKSCQWYISDSNTTAGGTAISGATSTSLTLLPAYVGKYVYVSATISTINSGAFIDNIVYDITDASRNVTATVAAAETDPGTNPGGNPGGNPGTDPSDSDYITTITTNPGYSITAEATYNAGSSLTLTLNGTTNASSTLYFVFFSNSNTAPTLSEKSNVGCEIDTDKDSLTKFKSLTSSNKILIADDWYMLNGYTKAYVVKRTMRDARYYCELLTTPIEVQKPAIRPLGNRYQIYLFGDQINEEWKNSISVYPYFPHVGTNGSHKVEVKIGIINDATLLNKLAKKTSDSLTLLLDYAKSHDGKQLQFNDDNLHEQSIGEFKVTNGAYYYIYTGYLNTDGLYRDLDDVTVVMGKNGTLVTDVKWEGIPDDGEVVPEEPSEDIPSENPRTGVGSYAAITLAVLAISGFIYYIIKKKSLFQQIK